MATLIYEYAGVKTFYDAATVRIVALDDAFGPKQHRISRETYVNIETAKASFFDNRVRWDEWTKGCP